MTKIMDKNGDLFSIIDYHWNTLEKTVDTEHGDRQYQVQVTYSIRNGEKKKTWITGEIDSIVDMYSYDTERAYKEYLRDTGEYGVSNLDEVSDGYDERLEESLLEQFGEEFLATYKGI